MTAAIIMGIVIILFIIGVTIFASVKLYFKLRKFVSNVYDYVDKTKKP